MELTFWNIARINLLAGALEYMMHAALLGAFLGRSKNGKKTALFAAAYMLYISLAGAYFYDLGFARMPAMLVLYYYLLAGIWTAWTRVTYKKRWRDAAAAGALVEFFYICAEDMSGFLISDNYDLSAREGLVRYVIQDWFGAAIVVAVFVLLLKHAKIDKAFQSFLDESDFKSRWRAVICFLPGLQICAVYLVNEKRLLHNSNPMASLLCLLLVSGVFNYATRCEIQKKQIKQQELSIRQQEFYIRNLEKTHREMRLFRHDYKNMMSGIYAHAEEGNLKEVQKFVSGMMDEFEWQIGKQIQQTSQIANIRNLEIKGLFVAKIAAAQTRQVRCDLEVMEPVENVNMPVRDFCRIAGILMDNAMEAVEGMKCAHFSVMLSQNEQCSTLRVKNPLQGEPLTGDIWREGYSTKGEGRGKGLASLRRIIDSHDKAYLFSVCENGEFIQEVKIQEA